MTILARIDNTRCRKQKTITRPIRRGGQGEPVQQQRQCPRHRQMMRQLVRQHRLQVAGRQRVDRPARHRHGRPWGDRGSCLRSLMYPHPVTVRVDASSGADRPPSRSKPAALPVRRRPKPIHPPREQVLRTRMQNYGGRRRAPYRQPDPIQAAPRNPEKLNRQPAPPQPRHSERQLNPRRRLHLPPELRQLWKLRRDDRRGPELERRPC